MMADLMPRTAGLRRPGAAALDLAYVAAGFTDGFFETGLQPWDVAAGSLLVTEAGGLIGNFTGEADFLDQRECLAGAPRIYGQLVPLLAKYSKFAGVDDKMRASDRVRAVDPSAQAGRRLRAQHDRPGERTPDARTTRRPKRPPTPAAPPRRHAHAHARAPRCRRRRRPSRATPPAS